MARPKTYVVLAAGAGLRLDRPSTPKPIVAVGGTSLLVRNLEHAEAVGFDRAVVVLGYKAREVRKHVVSARSWSIEIDFAIAENWKEGIGASILAARPHVDEEPCVLGMADHVFERPLFETVAASELDGAAVLALADRDLERIHDLDSAVKFRLDGDHVVAAANKLDDPDAVDAGLLVVAPELFEMVAKLRTRGSRIGLTDALDALAKERKVRIYDVAGALWHDVDTPYDLVRAEMDLRHRRRADSVRASVDADERAANYSFETGAVVETDVFVERGFVADPTTLRLIPESANTSPIFVFTDTRVNELYGDTFVNGLVEMGYDVERIVLQEGEIAKSLPRYLEIIEMVLSRGIDERSVLVSLGGGVVCNVCGFVASTLYRGIGLVHVPTTLMAQCDAAISHKQAMNGRGGKNLIGSYYAPTGIVVDVDVLQTLEEWRIPDGLAEVAKHALGQDRDYLEALLDYDGDLRNPDFLEMVVRKNIELKCELMATDPKEHREGLVLQYGHEVGHAVEYLSGYELFHGQSIAIGMMVSAHVSRLLGGTDATTVELHRELISKLGLPTELPRRFSTSRILETMRLNKKYLVEGTRMALVDVPGNIWRVEGEYAIPVDDTVIAEAIDATYARQ